MPVDSLGHPIAPIMEPLPSGTGPGSAADIAAGGATNASTAASGAASSKTFGASLGTLNLTKMFASIGDSISKAMSDRSQSEYQVQQLSFNAALSRLAAKDVKRVAVKKSIWVKQYAGKIKGQQKAAIAAQGLDPNVGSAVDVLESTDVQSTLDVLELENNAWREAWGHEVRAVTLEGQARYEKERGKREYISTLVGGGLQGLQYGASSLFFFGGM